MQGLDKDYVESAALSNHKWLIHRFYYEKLGIIIDYLQLYGLLWNSAVCWNVSSLWLSWSKYLTLFNIDVYSVRSYSSSAKTLCYDYNFHHNSYVLYVLLFGIANILLQVLIHLNEPTCSWLKCSNAFFISKILPCLHMIHDFIFLPCNLALFRMYVVSHRKSTVIMLILLVVNSMLILPTSMLSLIHLYKLHNNTSLIYRYNFSKHENYLQVNELSLLLGLNDSFIRKKLYMVSSFTSDGLTYQFTMKLLKILLLIISIFPRGNIKIQGVLFIMFMCLLTSLHITIRPKKTLNLSVERCAVSIDTFSRILFGNLAIGINQPYRSKTSNHLVYVMLLFFLVNTSYMLTNCFQLTNVFTLTLTEAYFLVIVNLLLILIALGIMMSGMVKGKFSSLYSKESINELFAEFDDENHFFRGKSNKTISSKSSFSSWPLLAKINFVRENKCVRDEINRGLSLVMELKEVKHNIYLQPPLTSDIVAFERCIFDLCSLLLQSKYCDVILKDLISQQLDEVYFIYAFKTYSFMDKKGSCELYANGDKTNDKLLDYFKVIQINKTLKSREFGNSRPIDVISSLLGSEFRRFGRLNGNWSVAYQSSIDNKLFSQFFRNKIFLSSRLRRVLVKLFAFNSFLSILNKIRNNARFNDSQNLPKIISRDRIPSSLNVELSKNPKFIEFDGVDKSVILDLENKTIALIETHEQVMSQFLLTTDVNSEIEDLIYDHIDKCQEYLMCWTQLINQYEKLQINEEDDSEKFSNSISANDTHAVNDDPRNTCSLAELHTSNSEGSLGNANLNDPMIFRKAFLSNEIESWYFYRSELNSMISTSLMDPSQSNYQSILGN